MGVILITVCKLYGLSRRLRFLAASPSAMRELLAICESFALDYNVLFNAGNSDFSVFTPRDEFSLVLQMIGPLLFLLYIRDIIDVCDDGSKLFMYADDAKLLSHINSAKGVKAL